MVFLNLGTAEPGHFERSSQKYPGFERATCRVRKSRTAAVVTWFLGGRSRSHVATPMGELAARRARGPFGPRGVSASEACAHNAQQRKTLKSFVFLPRAVPALARRLSRPAQHHHGFHLGHPRLDARVPGGSARRRPQGPVRPRPGPVAGAGRRPPKTTPSHLPRAKVTNGGRCDVVSRRTF